MPPKGLISNSRTPAPARSAAAGGHPADQGAEADHRGSLPECPGQRRAEQQGRQRRGEDRREVGGGSQQGHAAVQDPDIPRRVRQPHREGKGQQLKRDRQREVHRRLLRHQELKPQRRSGQQHEQGNTVLPAGIFCGDRTVGRPDKGSGECQRVAQRPAAQVADNFINIKPALAA